MKTMTATEASRSFAALLDEVERGEVVVVTRGGKRIATIGPAAASNGSEVAALLTEPLPDADFAADVMSGRDVVELGPSSWPDD